MVTHRTTEGPSDTIASGGPQVSPASGMGDFIVVVSKDVMTGNRSMLGMLSDRKDWCLEE